MKHKFDYDEIKNLIKSTSKETSVFVGTDSQIFGRSITFCTVIVVHFDNKHGSKIFKQILSINKKMTIMEKLLKEVEFTIEACLEIESSANIYNSDGKMLCERLIPHVDINPDKRYKSSIAYHTAKGWLEGHGLKPVFKPHAAIASHCADNFLRKSM